MSNTFTATVQVDTDIIANIDAVVTERCEDGLDTWTWVWGIDHPTPGHGYLKIDSGKVHHRETDGAFKLLATIIEQVRGRKADK